MKIRINYDLIQRLEEKELGVSVSKTLSKNFKVGLLALSFMTLYNIDSLSFKTIMEGIVGVSIATLAVNFFDNLRLSRKVEMIEAEKDLSLLCINLKGLNISTDLDLLRESNVYHRHYNIRLNKYKLPVLVQQKFIMVKTIGDGEISVLQEHNIGGNKWELSKEEPERQYKLSLAKQRT